MGGSGREWEGVRGGSGGVEEGGSEDWKKERVGSGGREGGSGGGRVER